MALNQADRTLVLAEFSAYLSARPGVLADPVAYTKADVVAAIAAIDLAIDNAIPTIRQSAGPAIPNAHKNKLLRFILERKIS